MERLGRTERSDDAGAESDATVYWVALVVGLVAVVATVLRSESWGTAPTLGAILVVLSGRGLLVELVLRLRSRRRSGR